MAEDEPFERCYCTGIDRAEVIAAMRGDDRCRTVDELRKRIGVCWGCQTCRPELERLVRDELAKAEQPTDRIERGPPST